MVDGRGGVRPHWRGVLGTLTGLDHDMLAGRARRLAQAAEEEGASPAWRCDPVPLPLTGDEFARLEAGLAQRARLLDALLADLYGSQRCLAEGWLPPALVYANPGFLRAARAKPDCTAAGPHLHAYAADLLRGPDGGWRVLADRTGGVPGIGYARECRRLLARVMPELFRAAPVLQLRPFFEAWADALQRMAPVHARAPVVALLTPGPGDPRWPEHLALSRDLACALVEAPDLTVRGGMLFLKALAGLQRVDVLLCGVPGAALDPLELASAPVGGVTGLLDAARSGTVRILNHPGAAAVEAPGFAAVLPALCGHVLDEPLLLPPAAPSLAPSRAPCLGPDGLEPQPVALRLFLVRDGAGWRTMPGGVARVLGPGEAVTEALPPGAVLKDVWVFAGESGVIRGPEPAAQAPVALRRGAGDMPSRVADDFFWLGRYVERLDAQARLARAGLVRRARGAPLPREMVELAVLLRCLHAAGLVPAEPGLPFEDAVRQALGPRGPVTAGLGQVARLVEALRDRMTLDTHGAFTHALRAARAEVADAAAAGPDGLAHAMDGLQRLATTVAGVAAEGMVRGGGRLFLDLGRRVERAMNTAYVLGTVLDQPPARVDGTLRLALELCDSAITYRSRYLSVLQPAPVLDLVLADAGNPRALAFQFAEAAALLDSAGDADLAAMAAGWQGRTGRLVKEVQMARHPADALVDVADALVGIGNGAADLSDRITRRFFALLPRLQSVGLETA